MCDTYEKRIYVAPEGDRSDNASRKKMFNISVQDETDGEWMFCDIKGCNFWTRKKVRMNRHQLSHVPGDDRVYQCPDCGIRMASLPKLLRHDRKVHTGFKDYECKICEAEVTDIAVHMRVSTEYEMTNGFNRLIYMISNMI